MESRPAVHAAQDWDYAGRGRLKTGDLKTPLRVALIGKASWAKIDDVGAVLRQQGRSEQSGWHGESEQAWASRARAGEETGPSCRCPTGGGRTPLEETRLPCCSRTMAGERGSAGWQLRHQRVTATVQGSVEGAGVGGVVGGVGSPVT
jgi:hypothetical protein